MCIVGVFQKISELWTFSREDYILFQGDQVTPDVLKYLNLDMDPGIFKLVISTF
jgi:hypothetical protein